MRDDGPDDDSEDTTDDLIIDAEAQLRAKPATTSLVLRHLDTIARLARMEEVIRTAPTGVVTRDDATTFTKPFARMGREAETLTTWRFDSIRLSILGTDRRNGLTLVVYASYAYVLKSLGERVKELRDVHNGLEITGGLHVSNFSPTHLISMLSARTAAALAVTAMAAILSGCSTTQATNGPAREDAAATSYPELTPEQQREIDLLRQKSEAELARISKHLERLPDGTLALESTETRGTSLSDSDRKLAEATVTEINEAIKAGVLTFDEPPDEQTRGHNTSWGFNALLWKETVTDPAGVYRVHYYNRCRPRRGERYLKMSDPHWGLYRTYECWAILARPR